MSACGNLESKTFESRPENGVVVMLSSDLSIARIKSGDQNLICLQDLYGDRKNLGGQESCLNRDCLALEEPSSAETKSRFTSIKTAR